MASLRVLYVTDRWDAPYLWRCRHGVEQLRLDGVIANVLHVEDAGLLAELASYSVVVLFRLPWSGRVAMLVDHARRHGATLVFDVDDLVFDVGAERQLPFFADLPRASQDEYRAQFPCLRRTVEACDYFLGTTPALARHAERLGKPAFVHPNLLSDGYLRRGRVLGAVGRRMGRPPTIAYVSGSNTHDRDLDMVSGPIARVLGRDPAVRLLLFGFVEVPAGLEVFCDRIARIPYGDWRAYPFALATCRVSLAPLAEINDFTNGKSALKYLEAAALGVPTVASATEAFRDAIRDGDNGFLATTADEWTDKICHLIDAGHSRRLGTRAYEDVRTRFSFSARRGALRALLERVAGVATGPAPRLLPIDPDRRSGEVSRVHRTRRRADLARQQWALLRGTRAPNDRAGTSMPPADEPLLDPPNFDRLLAAIRQHGSHWVRQHGPVVTRPAGAPGARLQWILAGDVRLRGDREYRCIGDDPQLVSPPLDLWAPDWRYLVVRMAVSTSASGVHAELFWRADVASRFSEQHSVRWSVKPDGAVHTYVIDLTGTPWSRGGAVQQLRFDPLNRPGRLHVDDVALVADLAQLEREVDVRAAFARRYLKGRGIECGALQKPLSMPADARVVYVDRLTEAQAREHYPELEGEPLAAPTVVGDVERLPVRTGGVDFCVANHLVEHSLDPIGALEELLRVVRPGGRLFVSVPDVGNRLDRHRAVTALAHLLADHDPALDRSQEHLAHYREFVDSAHAEMGDGERSELLARWVAQRYSVHFHTFDEGSYREVLHHVTTRTDSWVEEFVRNRSADPDEYVAILRKRGAGLGEAARSGVAIVMPVEAGQAMARASVERVLRHAPADALVVLVTGDRSDPVLVFDLKRVAARDARLRLIDGLAPNPSGGVVEHGRRQATGRDLVVLAGDALVTAGFVERLRAAAYDGDSPAIVSPITDEGGSFVAGLGENPGDSPVDRFAALVSEWSLRLRPELHGASALCAYVPAAVLRGLDDLDEGRGSLQGAVDRLCARARGLGFGIRLADDAYVHRAGSGAAPATTAPAGAPDPRLALVHGNLDLALKRHAFREPALLVLLHASFDEPRGGSEHHVRDLLRAVRLPRAVVAVPAADGLHLTEVFAGRLDRTIRYRLPLVEPPARFMLERPEVDRAIRLAVRMLDVGAVHVQHLINWPITVWRTLRELGLPFVLTCHDYYCVCPNLNLVDAFDNTPCCSAEGGPPADRSRCMQHLFAAHGLPPPDDPTGFAERHRSELAGALRAAERVIFPSAAARDVVARLQAFDVTHTAVIPHGYEAPPYSAEAGAPSARLRVALVGEVADPIKGARNHLALVARSHDLPIEWHVFGDADHLGFAGALRALGLGERLVLHGRYERGGLVARLRAARIDVMVFLPSWPETFSYTLSEALAAGVAVIVADQGALPERVATTGAGVIVRSVDDAAAALARLAADRTELARLRTAAARFTDRSLEEMADAYRPIYEEMLAGRAASTPLDVEDRRALLAAQRRAPPSRPEAPAGGANLPHYSRRWYPLYLRIARLTPPAVRRLGRTIVAARSWRHVRSYLFAEPARVCPNEGLELIRTTGSTAVYRAVHENPAFEFPREPFPTRVVRVIRFEMRCETQEAAFAQLYWGHRADERFSETKSVRVPIGDSGVWHEYAVCIDQTEQRALWDAGEQIHRLRFDPLNVPGTVELRRFSLCAVKGGAEAPS